jgi:polysaccharide biosynthesis transport protein
MIDNNNQIDRFRPQDEAILIRPSVSTSLTSLDQLSYNNYNPGPANEGFKAREYWRKIRKRKWLVLSIMFIATTVVSIESYRTKSIYQSTAKVAMEKNGIGFKVGDVTFSDSSERIRTLMLRLQTYPLLEEVVVKLRLDKNPRFLDIGERRSVVDAVKTISQKFYNPSGTQTPPLPLNEPPLIDELNLDESKHAEAENQNLEPYVRTLQGNLLIEQIPETSAIDISFSHTDPAIATDVANGVAKVFIDKSFEKENEGVTNTKKFIDTQARRLKADMEEAQQQLTYYSNNKDLFSMSDKDTLTAEKLTDIYGKSLKAEFDRILKEGIYNEVAEGRIAQLPEAFGDTKSAQIKSQLDNLLVEEARLRNRFGPENPKLKEVTDQIEVLKQFKTENTQTLSDRLKSEFLRAKREEQLVKESFEKAKSEVKSQNVALLEFNILKQKADTATSLYNEFMSKASQVKIEAAKQSDDLRVIEPARGGVLIGPRRMRSIMMGILISMIAGIGLALLIEYMDNTVKNVDDVARAAQLPTLALIPSMNGQSLRVLKAKKKAELKAMKKSQISSGKILDIGGIAPRSLQPQGNKLATLDGLSSVVEAYRMLRTSVLLSSAGKPPKSIMVTSSQPGEGKTTTAVNTAISLAQLGASVLLIDADLRRPAVHKTFKLPYTRGLSSYLSGSTSQIEDLIIKLAIPNLSVLTSGPIPPNPAELVGSERMKDMLDYLCTRYDHIVVDSPPLISVTDPVILSTIVDGSILVVQSGRSTRDLVRRARQELNSVGAKVFGVVLNNVDVKREGYDEYYFHRYYSSYRDQQKGASAG